MKKFKISFEFEADDEWSKEDVEEMVEKAIDPIYHLGDASIGEINVEEIEVERMKKHLVIKYFDTYPENKFYFDSKEEAEEFLKEKRITNMRYLTTYEYRGIVEVKE